MVRPPCHLIPLTLLAEVLGTDVERLVIVLTMFQGLKGVRLVNRPGMVVVVRLPASAVARLGLVRGERGWERSEGPNDVHPYRPRSVRLEASPVALADPQASTPLEILSRAEDPPDRIVNLRRWLEAWSRSAPKGRESPPNAFSLESLRSQLDAGSS
jgi:hypothetical protein